MKRKFFIVALCAIACVCSVLGFVGCFNGSDDSGGSTGEDSQGLCFTRSQYGSGYDCSGDAEKCSGDITVPATYKGQPLSNVFFNGCNNIVSITFAEGIDLYDGGVHITDCGAVSSITFPDTIGGDDESGMRAGLHIIDCPLLKNLRMPLKLGSRSYANSYTLHISNCPLMESISVAESEEWVDSVVSRDGVLYYKNYEGWRPVIVPDGIKETVTVPEKAIFVEGVFAGKSNLEGIIFTGSENLRFWDDISFKGCTSLKFIDFGSAEFARTSDECFENCLPISIRTRASNVPILPSSALKKLDITGGELTVNLLSHGFSGLQSVSVYPGAVVPDGFFNGIDNLAEAAVPYAYLNTLPASLKSLTILDGSKLEQNSLRRFSLLEALSLPSSMTEIYKGDNGLEFKNCTSLASIDVESGNDAFSSHCGVLYNLDKTQIVFAPPKVNGTVTILGSIHKIPDNIFSGARIAELILEEGITDIGDNAFAQNTTLATVSFPDSLTKIGDNAFIGSKLERVVIGENVKEIGHAPFSTCAMLKEISVVNNANYKDIDGNLYTKDGTVLIQYCIGKSASNFNVPQGVIEIGVAAFLGSELEEITLSESVEIIQDSAFGACESLTEILIPSATVRIGSYAFILCKNLQSVIFAVTEGWQNDNTGEAVDFSVPSAAAEYLVSAMYGVKNILAAGA